MVKYNWLNIDAQGEENMNITVYCGSSEGNDEIYMEKAKELGAWLAAHCLTLVYGGGKKGLMGVLANAVLANGGKVIGVIPEFLKTQEEVHERLSKLITVHTMAERKTQMLELGDAYIALPGGPGTLEEISEAIAAARLGRHEKPCILYNIQGCYDYLEKMFDHMVTAGFLNESGRDKARFVTSLQDIKQILQR